MTDESAVLENAEREFTRLEDAGMEFDGLAMRVEV